MSALLGVIALAQASALTLADLQGLNGAESAKRLLPPAVAEKVAGGSIQRVDRAGTTWIAKFWEAPRVTGPAGCERTVHAVRIRAGDDRLVAATPMTAERIDRYEQITTTLDVAASPGTCAANRTYLAVRPEDIAAGQTLLARLASAVRAAAGGAALPFQLKCDDVARTEVCRDPRAALAGLPLADMIALDPAGRLFTISGDTPTVLIGKSAGDPASWIVRLAGTGAVPDRVELVHAEMTLAGG